MKEKKKKVCSKVLMMSLCALIVALISVVMLSAHCAQAQGYPTKPIEIVVPWGPGNAVDIVSRLIADIGPKYLGQPVFVANKPGGAGSIGAADVIISKPDGYKMYFNNHPYFASTIYTQKLPFDPHDLVPLANFIESRSGMIVRADSPFKTL
jgi:tripartite-type tricarboxylate transporter receptor subunit TctC